VGRTEVSSAPQAADGEGAFSGRLLAPLVLYLRDHRSARIRDRILEQAGIDPREIAGPAVGWIPARRVERLLVLSAYELSGPDALEVACGYRLAEAWSAFRFAFWAPTLGGVLQRAADAERLTSTGSSCRLESLAGGRIRVCIETDAPESDAIHGLRRALWAHLPTVWGLRPLRVTKSERLSDRSLVLELAPRHLPVWSAPLFGAAGGLATAALLATVFDVMPPLAALLVGSGALVGWGWQVRRRGRIPPIEDEGSVEELRQLALSDFLGREELHGFGARADRWADRMTAELERRRRTPLIDLPTRTILRGLTHDFRNPLSVVRAGAELFEHELPPNHPTRPTVKTMNDAVDEIEERVTRLLDALGDAQVAPPSTAPVHVDTTELVRSVRRRLAAHAVGQELRTSVFRSREAPDSVEADRLALDRALDLLLRDAVRATGEGAIVVEIGGRPGRLVVKLSDTGRARSDADVLMRLRRVEPESESSDGPPTSIVDVVDRLGGRLEIDSKAGGTTFWLEVPVTPADLRRPAATALERVVRVRKLP